MKRGSKCISKRDAPVIIARLIRQIRKKHCVLVNTSKVVAILVTLWPFFSLSSRDAPLCCMQEDINAFCKETWRPTPETETMVALQGTPLAVTLPAQNQVDVLDCGRSPLTGCLLRKSHTSLSLCDLSPLSLQKTSTKLLFSRLLSTLPLCWTLALGFPDFSYKCWKENH